MRSVIAIASLLVIGCASKPPVILPEPKAPEVRVSKPRPSKPVKQPFENVFFDHDSDTLKPGQLRALGVLRAWRARNPVDLTCTGYADTTGITEYNLALSLRRAEAVAAHIPCRPVGAGETGRWGAPQHNRRVTIEVKPDTTKK